MMISGTMGESVEMDEFELYRSRAFSGGKEKLGLSKSLPTTPNMKNSELRRRLKTFRGNLMRQERCVWGDRSVAETKQDSFDSDLESSSEPLTPCTAEPLSKFAIFNRSRKLQRMVSEPERGPPAKPVGALKLSRSYSCRTKSVERILTERPVRPRTRSLTPATPVIKPSYLTDPDYLPTGTEGFEIYRVRSFTTTAKGIINRGDSFKIRSPSVQRSRQGLRGSAVQDNLTTPDTPNRNSLLTEIQPEDVVLEPEEPQSPSGLHLYRVLLHGSPGVGKKTLTQQFMTSEFMGNMDTTPEEQPNTRVSILLDEEESVMEFVQLAYDEDYHQHDVLMDAHVVVFSVTDRSSFRYAEARIRELKAGEDAGYSAVILVANKEDLVRNRVISEDEGVNLATRYSCKYTEVSAALSIKVDELLVGILRQIRLQPERQISKPSAEAMGQLQPVEEKEIGCLPRAAAGILRKFFKKPHYLSKSCENLLTL